MITPIIPNSAPQHPAARGLGEGERGWQNVPIDAPISTPDTGSCPPTAIREARCVWDICHGHAGHVGRTRRITLVLAASPTRLISQTRGG